MLSAHAPPQKKALRDVIRQTTAPHVVYQIQN